MGKKTEPLSGIDAAWLGMEEPTNLMMVSGILTFSKPIDFQRLQTVLERRWLKFDRFRQRVVQPQTPWATKSWFPPYWELDPRFDLKAHLHRVKLPAPGGRGELREIVSQLMSAQLDFSRPLWQMHLIENVGEGCVLMARLHHCIADGMALMHVLLSMTDQSADAPLPPPLKEEEDPDDVGLQGGLFEAFFKQMTVAAGTVSRLTAKVVLESLQTLEKPTHLLDLAQSGTENALALQRLFIRPDDPPTIFRGELGKAKRAAWSRPLALSDVKAVKDFTGATVNDILVTAMTGGLRRYLAMRNALPDGLSFRATVPVDLRKPEEKGQMGNKFGLVFLDLPVDVADPLQRLAAVKQRMDSLKDSQEAAILYAFMSAAGLLATEIQKALQHLLGAKATAVMTNMIGPQVPLYVAGEKIDHIMFWVPQSGRIGLGVSILSYDGKVYLGVATDAGLVPDPEEIINGFNLEFETLLNLAKARKAAQESSPAGNEPAPAEKPRPEAARKPLARKPIARKPIVRKPIAKKPIATLPQPTSAAPDAHSDRCQATTKAGDRCRNRAASGTQYCAVHQKSR